jgi:hypothetical protein
LSLSIICAYASKILESFAPKREVKYLFFLVALTIICILCYRETIHIFQNYNPPLKPPHSSLENPENLFKQFSFYESIIAVGLGALFSSYHLKSIVRHVFEDILEDLIEYINHWKTGGIVCSFEQLRIQDPIVRKRYKIGFPTWLDNPEKDDDIKTEKERGYVGKRLREIHDLSGIDFKDSHPNFFTGMDLNKCNFNNAKLQNKNLMNTIFENAELVNTNFKSSILIDANLAGAKVACANFENSNLTGICIESWNCGNEDTIPLFNEETECENAPIQG